MFKYIQYCNFTYRRKRVREAVKKVWPGNELPIFKGNPANLDRLNHLVDELEGECSFFPLSLPTVCFGRKGISRHALDCLNERRRLVRKGHNYDNKVKQ